MKKLIRVGTAAAIAALLAGCYVSLDEGAGAVGIQLPPPQSATGAAIERTGRIYVINGATLINVGDEAPYAEFDLEPIPGERLTEYSVGPVPAGPGYRVVVVFGSYARAGGRGEFFVPASYALSEEFAVAAGQANETEELTLTDARFAPIDLANTLGRELVGITFVPDVNPLLPGRLYAATGTRLYEATIPSVDEYGDVAFAEDYPVPGGRTINSLSLGADDTGPAVWVNTTRGILVGTGFDGSIMTNSGLAERSILDSGALYRLSEHYGYLQFDGGVSAVQNQVGAEPNWLEPADLSEIVVGRPVYSMDVERGTTATTGYFATKLGAFRLKEDILGLDLSTVQEIFASEFTDFFEVEIGGQVATITNVAVVNVPGGDAEHLYVGTPRGAMRIRIAGIGSPGTDRVEGLLIPQATGQVVKDIVAQGDLIVIVTNHFLLYSTNGSAATPVFTKVPLYASSVGEVTGILVDQVNEIALLSGTGGLVAIQFD